MRRGSIQEANDSFASEGPCSFPVEGRCGSSSAPTVAPGMHCSSILAGHVPGRQVATIVGAVPADTGSVVLGLEMIA